MIVTHLMMKRDTQESTKIDMRENEDLAKVIPLMTKDIILKGRKADTKEDVMIPETEKEEAVAEVVIEGTETEDKYFVAKFIHKYIITYSRIEFIIIFSRF